MDVAGDISVWLTPAIIIGLFLWLRADVRALENRVEKMVHGVEERVEKRIDGLEERFEHRFDGLDKRIDGLDKRMDGLDKRMDGLDKRMDGLDKRMDGLDGRLRAVEAGQSEIKGQLSFVRDYVLSRNLRAPETAAEGAPGD